MWFNQRRYLFSKSPGYTEWPGKWESATKWVHKEGWSLQPWLPHGFKTPGCLAGTGNVWMNCGTNYNVVMHRSFHKANLNIGKHLFVGNILMGAHYKDKKPGKIVVHDMVSDAPFPERIAMAKELLKGNRTFEVCDPVAQNVDLNSSVHRRYHWRKPTGWLVKKNDAPLKIYGGMFKSETTLRL